MEKLIITVAPSGRANLPSPPNMQDTKVQAEAVVDAYNAGASIGHVHGNQLSSPLGTRHLSWLFQALLSVLVSFI